MTQAPELTGDQAIAMMRRRPPVGAARLLGSEPLAIDTERGFARLTHQVGEEFCTEYGVLQGGFLTAMLDEAMAIAAVAPRGFRYAVPTLEMKTNYLHPVKPGRLVSEGQVVRIEGRVIYLDGRLYDPVGELAATASATGRFFAVDFLGPTPP
ncbi:MAG: PaaI family thioesterase [Alphaproteobacteria bacterium]|jgi:uncharacterized protein (TIGR00369 family)|nr:PaaI family thioesterase [Alphaproteobacteria bacterium]MDP6563737.1 PaaI family thioesterase [Alphaproteobacteria bacterium]MDP6814374.1 PaaI family thioesterase [Alphaproteobacteria bacterium]